MTVFRPCIDLHSGQVKQIIGGTLNHDSSELKTNHISELPAQYFSNLYKAHDLSGAHVIMLGPGNEGAAMEALRAWPGALQVGGGITAANAQQWIDRGAAKVSDTAKKPLRFQCSYSVVGHHHLLPLSRRQILHGPA